MVQDKVVRYSHFKRLNRVVAWCVFIIALLTYWLTLEPTASFWDCPEYIAVADKLQVGHSPGNPIWMLAARFFINFAPDVAQKALMVNAMSGLFTALAAMMCHFTVTLLFNMGYYGSRKRMQAEGIPKSRLIATLGAGVVAALSLTWSDSIWFSAVEAEVYAFSIFLTALTFWVVLHWSFAACDQPHGDKYLVLAAYLTGIGMGVHELNLLLLPALALIVWYRICKKSSPWRSWLALLCGMAAVALILFGCIPMFFSFAKSMELWMVNRLHMPFNTGLLTAWIILFFILASLCLIPVGRFAAGRVYRICKLTSWCALMFFIGFSSYALIVIRGDANPPVNTGVPGNIFDFASYYSREQYGSSPLIYGPAFGAKRLRVESRDASGEKSYRKYYNSSPEPEYKAGHPGDKPLLRNGFATAADSMQALADSRTKGDHYILTDYRFKMEMTPEMSMWFPRMHSNNGNDMSGYYNWAQMNKENMVRILHPTMAVDFDGDAVKNPQLPADTLYRPTYLQNFNYMARYQVAFMYARYFLWNFVGRQNDFTGHGEPDCGLPVSGITALDDNWTGELSKMPADAGHDNPGRNIYWFLPLILGFGGIVWQMCGNRRSRCAASVICALFIFTGVAIVFYLNQPPTQARDRDYAFLGSYYAFCLWIGFGVVALWSIAQRLLKRHTISAAWVAVGIGLIVPIQMLSQTADDHNRSHRTATTDIAHDIMAPLPENAVIFVSGDNSTFPLWYLQAVEEERRDVRVVCTTYLPDADYAASLHSSVWDAAALPMTMPENHLRMGRYGYAQLPADTTWRDGLTVLRQLYDTQSAAGFPKFGASRVYIPFGTDTLRIDLRRCVAGSNLVRQELLTLLDIIATQAANGYKRPLYWISTDGDGTFRGQLLPYMRREGSVMRLSPGDTEPLSLKVLEDAKRIYRWGGADRIKTPYYDPLTADRMSMLRRTLINHAVHLGENPSTSSQALQLINIIRSKMSGDAIDYMPYRLADGTNSDEGVELAYALWRVGEAKGSNDLKREAAALLKQRMKTAQGWQCYSNTLPVAWRPYINNRHSGYIAAMSRIQALLDSISAD